MYVTVMHTPERLRIRRSNSLPDIIRSAESINTFKRLGYLSPLYFQSHTLALHSQLQHVRLDLFLVLICVTRPCNVAGTLRRAISRRFIIIIIIYYYYKTTERTGRLDGLYSSLSRLLAGVNEIQNKTNLRSY